MTEDQIGMILKVLRAEHHCITSVLMYDADVLSEKDEEELRGELVILDECIEAMLNG